jgi:hypothetical protein
MLEKSLSNRKLEILAQHRAKGATAKEASIAAGYRTTGPAFCKTNRQRRNFRDRVHDLVVQRRELGVHHGDAVSTDRDRNVTALAL